MPSGFWAFSINPSCASMICYADTIAHMPSSPWCRCAVDGDGGGAEKTLAQTETSAASSLAHPRGDCGANIDSAVEQHFQLSLQPVTAAPYLFAGRYHPVESTPSFSTPSHSERACAEFDATMSLTNCRFYEEKYPEVESFVMVNVKQIAEMGAYVKLLEYGQRNRRYSFPKKL